MTIYQMLLHLIPSLRQGEKNYLICQQKEVQLEKKCKRSLLVSKQIIWGPIHTTKNVLWRECIHADPVVAYQGIPNPFYSLNSQAFMWDPKAVFGIFFDFDKIKCCRSTCSLVSPWNSYSVYQNIRIHTKVSLIILTPYILHYMNTLLGTDVLIHLKRSLELNTIT